MIIEKIKQEAVKAFAALYDTGGSSCRFWASRIRGAA